MIHSSSTFSVSTNLFSASKANFGPWPIAMKVGGKSSDRKICFLNLRADGMPIQRYEQISRASAGKAQN